MRWEHDVQIQDLREHPRELVVELGNLLASGSEATPDPKHPEFFEVKSDTHVFYVHISPITGKVLLLATWPAESMLQEVNTAAECVPARSFGRSLLR